jgi:hypothetical protein
VQPITALALFLAAVIWTADPGAAAAQNQAGPNIIITADAPGLQRQGGFQQIDTPLSRSQAPLQSIGSGSHGVTFGAVISQPGYYRLFLWWPQVNFSAGEVDVTVPDSQGVSTVTMDQGRLTGQWVPVGIFQFGHGNAQVGLTPRPGATLLADAVRLQYLGPQMPPLTFETDALPIAATGEPYEASLNLLAGTPPFVFAADPTRLPPGLVLDPRSGTIAGTATIVGSYQFDMEVFDQSGQRAVRTYTIEVVRGPGASTKSLGLAKSAARMRGKARATRPTDIVLKDGTPAGTPPNLSQLLSLIAALPQGEWLLANLNAYSAVWTPDDLRPLVGASNPTPERIIEAWSSFAWDPNRGDLWLFGGGHANYSGNDVYRWRGTTQMWERASLPSQIKQDDLGNWQAVDGWDAAPASAHTYDNNMFFPHIDRFVSLGGAAYDTGAPWRREVTPTTNRVTGPFFFNPSLADPNKVGGTTGSQVMRVPPFPSIVGGNMWANRDIYVNIPTNPTPLSHVNGCTAYADESGKDVAYIGARIAGGGTDLHLYKYTVNNLSNPALDTLVQVGQFWSGTSDPTACGIDPVRHVFVRTGNQTTPFLYWDLTTPGPTNRDVAFTPTDPTGQFGTLLATNQIVLSNCGFDFDPVRSRFVLWCGDGRVWALTPPGTLSANGWTIVKQPSPTLATPNGDVGTGILGKWKYIGNIDAFIGLQDENLGNIWIYKPIGWVNPAPGVPAAPTGVAASDGTSTSSVVITWNASQNATSYTVYRSTTAGVRGAQIGTPTTTTFTDTTPVPGTVYYYGVTATGSGGVSALSAQDSGFAAAVSSGGRLDGAASLPSTVDLTAMGTTDWVHWLPLNRKASTGLISNYVAVGTGTVTAYSGDPRSFVWTNGTPNATGNDTSGAASSGIGAGFSFSVPADTTTRSLVVYVGGFNSTGKLTAHLSDSSAVDFVDTSLTGTGRYDGYYSLVFHAASAGKQLQITWTQTGGSGSITLQGAALR